MRTIFNEKVSGMKIPGTDWLNNLPRLIMSKLVGGPGVSITQRGDQVVISAATAARSSSSTPVVATLPPIPAFGQGGEIRVYWASSTTLTGGTGDDQIWVCYGGQTTYTPLQKLTALSGTPVV